MLYRFSVDGLNWSPLRVALQCGAFGDRTVDHPAAPAMVRGKGKDDGLVHVYVQHDVPSIGLDRMTPWSLYKETVLLEPRSTLYRYTIGMCDLINETISALDSIGESDGSLRPCSDSKAAGQKEKLCAYVREQQREQSAETHAKPKRKQQRQRSAGKKDGRSSADTKAKPNAKAAKR
eukprot:6265811-Prymnesium_polylepis.1